MPLNAVATSYHVCTYALNSHSQKRISHADLSSQTFTASPSNWLNPFHINSESTEENGDNVEIILNDGNRGNGNSTKKLPGGKKSNKRDRKSADADRNALVARGKVGPLRTIINVWNVLTFSWIRPLMVTGVENIRPCLPVANV